MSNGLENTVTFSYLTHLLLFLFQPLKAGNMFLFLEKNYRTCFSSSKNPRSHGNRDFIILFKRTKAPLGLWNNLELKHNEN